MYTFTERPFGCKLGWVRKNALDAFITQSSLRHLYNTYLYEVKDSSLEQRNCCRYKHYTKNTYLKCSKMQ